MPLVDVLFEDVTSFMPWLDGISLNDWSLISNETTVQVDSVEVLSVWLYGETMWQFKAVHNSFQELQLSEVLNSSMLSVPFVTAFASAADAGVPVVRYLSGINPVTGEHGLWRTSPEPLELTMSGV